MKTLEWVKEHIKEVDQDWIDHRFTKRFIDFIPVDEWKTFGFSYTGPENEKPTVKEWTEENVLAQLKSDVAFGIEKATNHRGISSSLMYDCVKAWCVVLENGLEDTDYGYYGHSLFQAVDEKYNFGLVTADTFGESFFEQW